MSMWPPVKAIALYLLVLLPAASFARPEGPRNPDEWYTEGERIVAANAANALQAAASATQEALNIILFVGDGMGLSTVTAARILEGQLQGSTGEEHALFFERFPYLALSKTYNTNQQTPDSAGTMTAMMTGVKTKAGIIGVNQNTVRGDCDSMKGNELITALELAEIAGKSTGIVTTARITHATPAATYAHIMERNFEDDRDASKTANPGDCHDIARQLIEFPDRFNGYHLVNGLEVALGGGRRSFLPRKKGVDPEDGGSGERLDGRNLTTEWTQRYPNSAYVWNSAQLAAVDLAHVDHLLGLFDRSHMEYSADRNDDAGGEPTLAEMTRAAIGILSKNGHGFFLHVEAGRIDHAHHATNPYRALTDTIELAKAVETAYSMTDPGRTLIIVTADHSHVFTIGGYPTRGNPILGKVIGNDAAGNPEHEPALAADHLPYTTLGYTNGRGFAFLPNGGDAILEHPINFAGRTDLTGIDTEAKGFHPEVVVPMEAETHSAEDVAIYATGPGASLISGVMEQHALFHVMNRAGRLEQHARHEGWSR